MFIGGEFYYDQRWNTGQSRLAAGEMVFLNGGAACLTVIGDFLRARGVRRVLLPAYLCPSILTVLERCRLEWAFYRVNEDLSIDLASLERQAAGCGAVYFINYFGFRHSAPALELFRRLSERGLILIEDNVHAGFSDALTGDFVFNSIRKLAPYDGGYLLARGALAGCDLAPYIEKYAGLPNRRLPLIRAYRRRLYDYLYEGRGDHAALVDLYNQAARLYETDVVVLGDEAERRQIEQLDWDGIREARRRNYNHLLEWVSAIPELCPLFPALQAEMMPFGLPVYVRGVSRDALYEALGQAGVGLVIHWDEIRSDPRTAGDPLACSMAARMLTLPIDQRAGRKQIDFLAMTLVRAIAAVK